MKVGSPRFKEKTLVALADPNLRQALGQSRKGFVNGRAALVAGVPEFEAMRDQARDVKNHVLANLDHYLERFEASVTAAGGQVHWAADAEDARRIVLDICQRVDAKVVTKGKNTAEHAETKVYPGLVDDSKAILQQAGLLEGVEQVVQGATSEGIMAQIVHSMSTGSNHEATFGQVPVSANIDVINAIVIYLGNQAAERMSGTEPITINGKEPEAAALSVLVHEVSPEARYYLASSMINQLRYPNLHTEFFSQLLLHIFGNDLHDPEDTDIRQEITRVLLERLIGFWPQPWGLMYMVVELVKNEKYMFFDLPFIKSTPEVCFSGYLFCPTSANMLSRWQNDFILFFSEFRSSPLNLLECSATDADAMFTSSRQGVLLA